MEARGHRNVFTTWLVRLGLVMLVCSGGVCLSARASSAEDQQEEALRVRAGRLYTLLQGGSWSRAEEYMTEDSKINFRDQQKNPFLSFQVEAVKVDADGQAATVVVRLTTMTTFSATPVDVPQTTRWRLVKGIWYLELPKQDPEAVKRLFEPSTNQGALPASPPAEELKFKGHRYWLGNNLQPGEVKVARFPFTNVTDHVVTLSAVLTGCECLKVKTQKKQYKPGESGELAIEFNSTGYERKYEQTILVKTDPGNLTTHLLIGAIVLPRLPQTSQPESKPSGPQPEPNKPTKPDGRL